MRKMLICAAATVAAIASRSHAAQSIGIKFASDEPNSFLAPGDVAGVFPQAHWNDEVGALSPPVPVVDSAGNPTPVTVSWHTSNVWSSTGVGEENNHFPAGPDRALMSGYLDDLFNNTEVNIAGLPVDPAGYDVYIYALDGVGGRGGLYFGTGQIGISVTNPDHYILDEGQQQPGDFLLYQGVHPDTTGHLFIGSQAFDGSRAPINAVELVALTVAIPEPAGITALALLAVVLARKRKTQKTVIAH